MAKVIHKVKFQYGSGSGTTDVYCDADDDLEVVKAKVRKQESLNYLPMGTYSVKIISTTRLDY